MNELGTSCATYHIVIIKSHKGIGDDAMTKTQHATLINKFNSTDESQDKDIQRAS